MKINNVSMNKVVNLYGDKKRELSKNVKSEKKDSLEISTLGKSLSRISSGDPLIDSNVKVEALRNEVAKGTYNNNSTLTAKKIIDIIKGREV